MNDYTEAAVSSLKEAALISLIDASVAVAAFLSLGFLFFDTFGLILLIEGAVLLLVGGALGFAGQPGLRRVAGGGDSLLSKKKGRGSELAKRDPVGQEREAVRLNDVRAAFYMITGLVLFLESFSLALIMQ